MPVSVSVRRLYLELLSLSVYRGVLDRPVTAALVRLLESAAGGEEQALCVRWGELCRVLLQRGRLDSLPAAVAQEILEDENPFSIRLAAGALPDAADPDRMAEAARRDLDVLYRAATIRPETLCAALETGLSARLPDWGVAAAAVPLDTPWGDALPALAAYHAAHGCGRFAAHRAFLWRDGALHPVEHPDPIRLSDLKDYAAQRQIAVDNTLAFLDGFEANNMLLYGDRGTGKSSTVKALLNEYAGRGLRMIELPKETLRELPELTGFLAGLPMKFILFIDDLSFSGNDDSFAALKAVLEGGLASRERARLRHLQPPPPAAGDLPGPGRGRGACRRYGTGGGVAVRPVRDQFDLPDAGQAAFSRHRGPDRRRSPSGGGTGDPAGRRRAVGARTGRPVPAVCEAVCGRCRGAACPRGISFIRKNRQPPARDEPAAVFGYGRRVDRGGQNG